MFDISNEQKSKHALSISVLSILCGAISFSLAFYYVHLYSMGNNNNILENLIVDTMLSGYIVLALMLWISFSRMDQSVKYYKIINYYVGTIFVIGVVGNIAFIKSPIIMFIFGCYSLLSGFVIFTKMCCRHSFSVNNEFSDSSISEKERLQNEEQDEYTVSKLLYKKDSQWFLKQGIFSKPKPVSNSQALVARKILKGRVSLARTVVMQVVGVSILLRLLNISFLIALAYFLLSLVVSELIISRKIDLD